MINKELFCEVIKLIQKQRAIDDQFSDALGLICDGIPLYTGGENYIMALEKILKSVMNDEDDSWICWWLYENVEKKVYCDSVEVDVSTPELLYDFLTSPFRDTDGAPDQLVIKIKNDAERKEIIQLLYHTHCTAGERINDMLDKNFPFEIRIDRKDRTLTGWGYMQKEYEHPDMKIFGPFVKMSWDTDKLSIKNWIRAKT